MTRTAADLLTGRALAIAYCDLAGDIEREAAEPKLRNMPLTVRKLRRYAWIARRAALAERDHPDTPEAPCSVCGGETVCIPVPG